MIQKGYLTGKKSELTTRNMDQEIWRTESKPLVVSLLTKSFVVDTNDFVHPLSNYS